jgi:hypothetical protein
MKPRRGLRLSILSLIVALGLSGCDYLLEDPYGGYLQEAAAFTDLRGALAPGFELDMVEGMTIAKAGDRTFLFARLVDTSGSAVFRSLDPSSLEQAGFSAAASGNPFRACSDSNSELVVGAHSYYPSTLSEDSGAAPPEGWILADIALGRNYLFPAALAASATLECRSYDGRWENPAVTQRPFDSGGGQWRVARAVRLGDGSAVILAFSGEGGTGSIKAARYPSVGAFASSTDAAIGGTSASSSASVDVDSSVGGIAAQDGVAAWATEQGLVVLVSDSGGYYRFERYGYDGRSALDDYRVSARHDARFYFEPSGSFWYLYDRASGRLYRLRTWWGG